MTRTTIEKIAPDRIAAKRLGDITASEFLEMLAAQGRATHIAYWGEKKKYELYVEPERPKLDILEIGRLWDILRGEKKKVEREIDPVFDRFPPDWRQLGDDPLDRLAERVADRISVRLGR